MPDASRASLEAAEQTGPDTVPMPEERAPQALPLQPAAATTSKPSPFETLKQWLVGGNTIVKAGVAILFVGLAFLAKYAAEHTDVPMEWRLAAIGAAAVVLLGFGWRLRLSRPGYAQVLQGGAVAVLYLTLFAAFRFYGLLAAGPAFALMVAVAMLAAALAVLQDARSLAVIGALGGFVTPLIVSTGSDNATALFAYYLVLDIGIAAVAWFRTWRSLNLIGFFATFLVATAWGVLRYRPESFAMSEAFLIAFFLLFVLIMLLPARRAAAGTAHRERRLGQQHPAVRPADDRLRPAARAGAPHAVRHRALGAGDGRLLRPAGDDDEEARRARAALRCQSGDRHRLPDPGHSVRP